MYELVHSLEAITKVLIDSVKAVHHQAEAVVQLYTTVTSEATEQKLREANLLKRALETKATEQAVFKRARVVINAMQCTWKSSSLVDRYISSTR